MIINIHAGHNAAGKRASGAVGLLNESTEARKVKDEVIRQLRGLGDTVYDCTVDNAESVSANLREIVAKCNAHKADLDVSIHFNSGAKDTKGNGKTTGTEAFIYSSKSPAKKYAEAVCKDIAKLGFTNRGVKVRNGLYVLRHTIAPAMLIECCFVDDKDDAKLYHYKKIADAIVHGIAGKNYVKPEDGVDNKDDLYRVQVGAYAKKDNAEDMAKKLKEAGFDAIVLKK